MLAEINRLKTLLKGESRCSHDHTAKDRYGAFEICLDCGEPC